MLGRLLRRPAEVRSHPFVVHGPGVWGVVGSSAFDALTNAAVWACVDVLASSVSSLPVDAVRAVGSARLPVLPAPPVLVDPSAVVERDVWMYQLVQSLLSDGNGFGLVTATDALAHPTMIELVDPDRVTERKVVDGVVQARVEGTIHRRFPAGDLWHVPGKMVRAGSPFALSPFAYANKAIRSALAAEDFGLRYFDDGWHPSVVVRSDKDLTSEQAQRIKASIMAIASKREPAVMGTGLTVEPFEESDNAEQFIDLQRFMVEQACRFFRVPPAMVYASTSGQNVTYANVTQADLHYLKHSLDALLSRISGALGAITDVQVKFNWGAFLRSDAEGRNKVYDLRLKNKTMSVNEVRALEDEAPFADPEFNEPGIPGGPTDAKPEEGAK